jgi:hypothetical protein
VEEVAERALYASQIELAKRLAKQKNPQPEKFWSAEWIG